MRGYRTSKDYKQLRELLDKGYEVVCFTTYDFLRYDGEPHKPLMTTDVCTAKLLNRDNQYAHYTISCRGTGFLDYWLHGIEYPYSFEEMLELHNIEFIEPEER